MGSYSQLTRRRFSFGWKQFSREISISSRDSSIFRLLICMRFRFILLGCCSVDRIRIYSVSTNLLLCIFHLRLRGHLPANCLFIILVCFCQVALI
jgi:hypothetical protein